MFVKKCSGGYKLIEKDREHTTSPTNNTPAGPPGYKPIERDLGAAPPRIARTSRNTPSGTFRVVSLKMNGI